MALVTTHQDTKFGVGDRVKVIQSIKDEDKTRRQVFEGMVIGIKGHKGTKTFTVRRVGAQQIGIERIFPLNSPTIEKVEIVKKGGKGVRRAKLYYTRKKSAREINKIYMKAEKKDKVKGQGKKKRKAKKRKTSKKPAKNASKKK
jgi:large subunit ribosomal protein L19